MYEEAEFLKRRQARFHPQITIKRTTAPGVSRAKLERLFIDLAPKLVVYAVDDAIGALLECHLYGEIQEYLLPVGYRSILDAADLGSYGRPETLAPACVLTLNEDGATHTANMTNQLYPATHEYLMLDTGFPDLRIAPPHEQVKINIFIFIFLRF